MLTFSDLLFRVIEAFAITVAIYLVTRRTLQWSEMGMLVVTISITFMVLDFFAPRVAVGARQGSGFGLGFMQVAGNAPYPRQYFDHDAPFTMKPVGPVGPNKLNHQVIGNDSRQHDGMVSPGLEGGSPESIEGMDDPEAIRYYNQYNAEQMMPSPNEINEHPDLLEGKTSQTPSIILQQFNQDPFGKQTDQALGLPTPFGSQAGSASFSK